MLTEPFSKMAISFCERVCVCVMEKITHLDQENAHFLSSPGSPGTKEVSLVLALTQWCVGGQGRASFPGEPGWAQFPHRQWKDVPSSSTPSLRPSWWAEGGWAFRVRRSRAQKAIMAGCDWLTSIFKKLQYVW